MTNIPIYVNRSKPYLIIKNEQQFFSYNKLYNLFLTTTSYKCHNKFLTCIEPSKFLLQRLQKFFFEQNTYNKHNEHKKLEYLFVLVQII